VGTEHKLQGRKTVEQRKLVIDQNQFKSIVFKSGQEVSAGYLADEMIGFKELLNELRVLDAILQQQNPEWRPQCECRMSPVFRRGHPL
jgi:hypothetical protein